MKRSAKTSFWLDAGVAIQPVLDRKSREGGGKGTGGEGTEIESRWEGGPVSIRDFSSEVETSSG